MRQIRTAIITSFFLFTSLVSVAKDFTVTSIDGRQMHFNVLDENSRTVELSCGESDVNPNYAPTGNLTLPLAVQFEGKAYMVVSIGERALAGADMLKSIVLPSSITRIAPSAFEGCIFLSEVILPGSNTVIAPDAFKGCSSLNSVKFGSDWTYIDFTPFQDCPSLMEIDIPSKVKTISGISSLTSIRKIKVDEANPYFVSVAGMLYDRTCSELIYCPSDCSRELVIPEGTVSIRRGAMSGCLFVEDIVLPSTLKSVSYDEFAGMHDLKSITFASEQASVTGMKDGRDVFALEMNPDVNIYVQKKSMEHYRIAIENGDGVYVAPDGSRKNLDGASLAGSEQVKKVKRSING